MKRILVTGSNGQLGLTFQEIHKEYPKLEFVFKNSSELNITDIKKVEEIFKDGNFDYCINCAAYTNVEQAEKTPEIAYLVNGDGTRNIALLCKEHNVILVHISTDYVFDGEKGEAYTIEDITNPINEYGKSKLKGEEYIQNILKDFYIIRTSWLYSKKTGNNFYQTILSKARKGEVLKITDAQVGCPTEIINLVKHIVYIIVNNKQNFGLQHFTDEIEMTWYDFAEIIIKENELTEKVKLVRDSNYRIFAERPKYSVLR